MMQRRGRQHRRFSSAGRASDWRSEGPVFDPRRWHIFQFRKKACHRFQILLVPSQEPIGTKTVLWRLGPSQGPLLHNGKMKTVKKRLPPPWIEHGAFRSSVWRSPSWAKAAWRLFQREILDHQQRWNGNLPCRF